MNMYILNPTKIEDYINNVRFQLDSVEGYLSIDGYESALIKAEFLVKELKTLVQKTAEKVNA